MPVFDDALTLVGPKPNGSLASAKLSDDDSLLVSLSPPLAGTNADLDCLDVRIAHPSPVKQYSPSDLNVNNRSMGTTVISNWVNVSGYSKITAYIRVHSGTLQSSGQKVELLGVPYGEDEGFGDRDDWLFAHSHRSLNTTSTTESSGWAIPLTFILTIGGPAIPESNL